ncbi:hypothetical protein RHAB15C_0001404 (plasmid) [Candidatus Rhabdochlamydia porcellionis]|jgi:hypothetical protein|uniref:Uncharacterized protein n=1 Tax=Candidatus Rhabdochlamydia porcellionis TaxID=225148 RepID=A0ABX8Z1B2_9BACT|nr:hypothetical protein RHAB15C_0001404 [Candidatus Rhabdochlamydia porcellionis]
MLPTTILNVVLDLLAILPLGTLPLLQTLLLQVRSLIAQGQSSQQIITALISAITSVTPSPASADIK